MLNLGIVHEAMGEWARATDRYELAMQIWKEFEDKSNEAHTLSRMPNPRTNTRSFLEK